MTAIRCPFCGTVRMEAAASGSTSFICQACGRAVEPSPQSVGVVPPPLPTAGGDDQRWSPGPPEPSASRWSTEPPLGDDDSGSSSSVSLSLVLPEQAAARPATVRPFSSAWVWAMGIAVVFLGALIGVVLVAKSLRPWMEARRMAAQRSKVEYWFPQLDEGPDPAQLEAARAIVALGPQAVVDALDHISMDPGGGQPPWFVTGATRALAGVGEPALPGLCEGLRSPEPRIRAAAACIIAQMGPAALPARDALVAALDDESRWVRKYAIDSLGSLNEEAAPAAGRLVELVASPDVATRRRASEVLGRIGPKALGAVAVLDRVAANDPDASVREAAGLAWKQIHVAELARQAREEAYGESRALLAALEGEDASSAVAAAQRLGNMGFEGRFAAPGLALLLRTGASSRRVAAAQALGRLGLGAAPYLPTLEVASEDRDPDVRAAASKALESIHRRPR